MLKILCAAEPSGVHGRRYLELLVKANVEVYVLDAAFESIDLPLAAHWRWPRSCRRTIDCVVGSTLGNPLADWMTILQLKFAWQRSRAQLCHVIWLDERVWHCALAGLRPLVLTVLGRIGELDESDPHLLRKIKQSLARVDLLIASSDEIIKLAEQLAESELKSLVLPIGIDTERFRPGYSAKVRAWRAELCIPQEARIVLSPRVIQRNYRQAEILRAFAVAVQNHGLDAFILFNKFHGDRAYVEEVRSGAITHGVSERVRIIDEFPYAKLPILYDMSDLAINFPILDGFPTTLLECAACELPVLTNRRPAYTSNEMAEFLLFMDGEDSGSIGRQIASLCGNDALRPKARAARDHVVNRFNEKAFADTLLGAYDALLSATRLAHSR